MRPIATVCALLFTATVAHAATPDQLRFFEAKVRPLLLKHCQECHGSKKQNGSLRLDTAAGFKNGGDSGALVDAKKSLGSLLLQALRHEGPKMPPKTKLPAEDIETFTQWVKDGAPWPDENTKIRPKGIITDADRAFWAFQPVRSPVTPNVTNAHWVRNGIDRFVLARLEAKGLTPSRSADRGFWRWRTLGRPSCHHTQKVSSRHLRRTATRQSKRRSASPRHRFAGDRSAG